MTGGMHPPSPQYSNRVRHALAGHRGSFVMRRPNSSSHAAGNQVSLLDPEDEDVKEEYSDSSDKESSASPDDDDNGPSSRGQRPEKTKLGGGSVLSSQAGPEGGARHFDAGTSSLAERGQQAGGVIGVMDAGAAWTRVGLAGTQQPIASFPSIVWDAADPEAPVETSLRFGAPAVAHWVQRTSDSNAVKPSSARRSGGPRWPAELPEGMRDETAMWQLTEHALSFLPQESDERNPLLWIDSPTAAVDGADSLRRARGQWATTLLEGGLASSVSFHLSRPLSLVAHGRWDGVVADLGHGSASAAYVRGHAVNLDSFQLSRRGGHYVDHMVALWLKRRAAQEMGPGTVLWCARLAKERFPIMMTRGEGDEEEEEDMEDWSDVEESESGLAAANFSQTDSSHRDAAKELCVIGFLFVW